MLAYLKKLSLFTFDVWIPSRQNPDPFRLRKYKGRKVSPAIERSTIQRLVTDDDYFPIMITSKSLNDPICCSYIYTYTTFVRSFVCTSLLSIPNPRFILHSFGRPWPRLPVDLFGPPGLTTSFDFHPPVCW